MREGELVRDGEMRKNKFKKRSALHTGSHLLRDIPSPSLRLFCVQRTPKNHLQVELAGVPDLQRGCQLRSKCPRPQQDHLAADQACGFFGAVDTRGARILSELDSMLFGQGMLSRLIKG